MDKASKIRVAVGALSLSAAALIGLATHEGYTGKAVIPTKGDVPTVGFGAMRTAAACRWATPPRP